MRSVKTEKIELDKFLKFIPDGPKMPTVSRHQEPAASLVSYYIVGHKESSTASNRTKNVGQWDAFKYVNVVSYLPSPLLVDSADIYWNEIVLEDSVDICWEEKKLP